MRFIAEIHLKPGKVYRYPGIEERFRFYRRTEQSVQFYGLDRNQTEPESWNPRNDGQIWEYHEKDNFKFGK